MTGGWWYWPISLQPARWVSQSAIVTKPVEKNTAARVAHGKAAALGAEAGGVHKLERRLRGRPVRIHRATPEVRNAERVARKAGSKAKQAAVRRERHPINGGGEVPKAVQGL